MMEFNNANQVLMIICLLAGCFMLVYWTNVFRRKYKARKQNEEEELKKGLKPSWRRPRRTTPLLLITTHMPRLCAKPP